MAFPVHIGFSTLAGTWSHSPGAVRSAITTAEADTCASRQGSFSIVPMIILDVRDGVILIDSELCVFGWAILDLRRIPIVEDIAC